MKPAIPVISFWGVAAAASSAACFCRASISRRRTCSSLSAAMKSSTLSAWMCSGKRAVSDGAGLLFSFWGLKTICWAASARKVSRLKKVNPAQTGMAIAVRNTYRFQWYLAVGMVYSFFVLIRSVLFAFMLNQRVTVRNRGASAVRYFRVGRSWRCCQENDRRIPLVRGRFCASPRQDTRRSAVRATALNPPIDFPPAS